MARGYDNIWYNYQMLLDLQLREVTGTLIQDYAKPHHVCAMVGAPSWNQHGALSYLDFVAGTGDHIISASGVTGDLNFTTGAFSCAVWIRPDVGGNRYLFNRGLTLQDGWGFFYDTNESLVLATHQNGVDQFSEGAVGDVVTGVWSFVGATRSGAIGRVYVNGVDTTATFATHISPLTSARNLYIGRSDLGAGSYDGDMWRPRIWNRTVPDTEMASIYAAERGLFGV